MLPKLVRTMRPELLLTVMALVQITVALGGYFYFIKVPLASQSRMSVEYDRFALMSSDKATLEAQLATAKQTLADAKAKFDTHFQRSLPTTSHEIVGTISEVSSALQVELVSVSPLPQQSVDFLKASTYRVEARGKFEHVSHWLQQLAARLPGVMVSKLNMTAPADGATITVTVDMLSYAVDEESSA